MKKQKNDYSKGFDYLLKLFKVGVETPENTLWCLSNTKLKLDVKE
jgi:hypothetical protein